MNSERDDLNGTEAAEDKRRGYSRRTRLGIGAAFLIALGAMVGGGLTVAGQSFAHGFGGHRHATTVEEAKERAADKAAWVAGMLDATPEQEKQIESIAGELVDELFVLRDEHRANKQQMMEMLIAGSATRESFEPLRLSELQLADQASARVVDALHELSQILTDEQRDKVARFTARWQR